MKYLSNVASLELFPEKCTACGMCMDVCPHDVFFKNNGVVAILDRDRCMECGACAHNCASGALAVAKGVGCAAALINSMITGGEPTCGCSDTDKNNCC